MELKTPVSCRYKFATIVLAATLFTSAAAAAELPIYRFVDLGALDGANDSAAGAISDNGVVMFSDISQKVDGHGIRIWMPGHPKLTDGKVLRPNFPAREHFDAIDVNDKGQLLLFRSPRQKTNPGLCLWTPKVFEGPDGTVISLNLQFPDCSFDSNATLLNDGSIIGNFLDRRKNLQLPRVPMRGAPSTPEGQWTMSVIQDAKSGKSPDTTVSDHNSRGAMVTYRAAKGDYNLWRLSEDKAQWRGTCIGQKDPTGAIDESFQAEAISNTNIVAGSSNGRLFALWLDEKDEVIRSVPIERPERLSGELRIKGAADNGAVIGNVGNFRSFVWWEKRGSLEIGAVTEGVPAGWQLTVSDINASGWIIGTAYRGKAPPPRGSGLKLPSRSAFVLVPKADLQNQ